MKLVDFTGWIQKRRWGHLFSESWLVSLFLWGLGFKHKRSDRARRFRAHNSPCLLLWWNPPFFFACLVGEKMWYLCVFYHRLLDYRKAEVESLAHLFGVLEDGSALQWKLPQHHHPDSPFHFVYLPSEDVARNIANRSKSSFSFYLASLVPEKILNDFHFFLSFCYMMMKSTFGMCICCFTCQSKDSLLKCSLLYITGRCVWSSLVSESINQLADPYLDYLWLIAWFLNPVLDSLVVSLGSQIHGNTVSF